MKGKVVIVGLCAELRPASGKIYRAEFRAFQKPGWSGQNAAA